MAWETDFDKFVQYNKDYGDPEIDSQQERIFLERINKTNFSDPAAVKALVAHYLHYVGYSRYKTDNISVAHNVLGAGMAAKLDAMQIARLSLLTEFAELYRFPKEVVIALKALPDEKVLNEIAKRNGVSAAVEGEKTKVKNELTDQNKKSNEENIVKTRMQEMEADRPGFIDRINAEKKKSGTQRTSDEIYAIIIKKMSAEDYKQFQEGTLADKAAMRNNMVGAELKNDLDANSKNQRILGELQKFDIHLAKDKDANQERIIKVRELKGILMDEKLSPVQRLRDFKIEIDKAEPVLKSKDNVGMRILKGIKRILSKDITHFWKSPDKENIKAIRSAADDDSPKMRK